MSEVSHCWTEMPAFPLAPCLHPPFASHPVVLFVWSEPRDFGAMPSCTATSPAHTPSQGCRVHPWQQPSSCSTQKGSCPKSVPQFISVILAVNARGRAQSLCCINRAAELSVGNASKSSFPADYFVLESLCRISAQLFVLGIKKKKENSVRASPDTSFCWAGAEWAAAAPSLAASLRARVCGPVPVGSS